MKTFDIQKEFFSDIIAGNNMNDKNKYIYNELILFRFLEVIKSTFPIYCDYIKDDILQKQIKEFIIYGSNTSYVWKISFEFKDFLFEHKNISKIQKEILIFEIKQIQIYASCIDIKSKNLSYKRKYKLSKNAYIQKHNFDIINQTYKKIKTKYYLIYKDINDYDVYYLELSKFLYLFFKYQRANNTINKAIKLASKQSNLNYYDAKNISKNAIENFINTAILI